MTWQTVQKKLHLGFLFSSMCNLEIYLRDMKMIVLRLTLYLKKLFDVAAPKVVSTYNVWFNNWFLNQYFLPLPLIMRVVIQFSLKFFFGNYHLLLIHVYTFHHTLDFLLKFFVINEANRSDLRILSFSKSQLLFLGSRNSGPLPSPF